MTLIAPPEAHPSVARLGVAVRDRLHLRALASSPLAVVGLTIVLLYVAVALLAPVIAPPHHLQDSPYDMRLDFGRDFEAPSREHPFGTTEHGADVLYGIVWGARLALVLGIGVTLAGVTVGAVLGAAAGYFGGWVDDALMRVTDVFLSVPTLVLGMAVGATLGQSLDHVAMALVVVWWPPYARLVRGQVVTLRELPFVEAARGLGLSEWRVLMRHVLPNASSPLLVQMALDVGAVVLASSALAFIGFAAIEPNLADWGVLVAKGQERIATGEWWAVTFPGVAIFGFVLGFNLLGDGLRDLLDPQGARR